MPVFLVDDLHPIEAGRLPNGDPDLFFRGFYCWNSEVGGCVAIGFQSFAQVKQVYGEGAQTIIENCGNLLLLRAGASEDGGTAKLVSELIGGREVERDDVSRSRTHGRFTTRSMSMQTRRTVEDVALASEIMQLGTREGFLKRATQPRWVRVRFPYTAYRERTEPTLLR